MTARRTAPHGRPVETVPASGDGLAALRLAVAMHRDPQLGRTLDRVAYRAMPKTASAPGPKTASAPGKPEAAPPIPVPSPPSEPTGELATVMDIVARAQAGDADAFGELYDRYVDVVYRYIYYRVSNVSLAEDLTSETFIRALRRISSYTWQGRDFGAWLVTIARNLIADHFKSGRYRLEVATSDLVQAGADVREEGPENEVLSSLTNAALLEAVKSLGAEQQECISLRFLQGMSVAETAAIMGKNEGAIKALQYRAVKSLSRLLPEDLLG
jgi:RNA polymerase sigma-70 factor, ECF subfamily